MSSRRIEAPHCEATMSEGIVRIMVNLMNCTPAQRVAIHDAIVELVEDVIKNEKNKTQNHAPNNE